MTAIEGPDPAPAVTGTRRLLRRARSWLGVGSIGLCLTVAAATAGAQDTRPRGVAGPANGMATRSVSQYLGLERALQDGIDQNDHRTVSKLLAAGFEARTAADQDAATADAWWRHELASASHRLVVRNLSVREFDDLAIVSFLLDGRPAHAGAKAGPTRFVVDVWRRSSGQLLTRYLDQPAHPPPVPARPSGRE